MTATFHPPQTAVEPRVTPAVSLKDAMKPLYKIMVLVFLSLFMASCSYDEMNERLIPKEESDFAREYLSKLRAQDYEYVKSILSPELEPQVDNELLAKMAALFRPGDPISIKIIGSQVNVFNGQWQGNFSFEYEFESGWNLANTALRKVDGGYEVIGLNVYQTEASQKEINAFTLSSKSPIQYFVLFLAIVVPVFILFTLVVCIRTPIPRKKWMWIIFILLGVGAIQVNWTNGAYGIQLLSVHLFGASAASAGPAAPWVISASIPLGAFIFWLKRRKFILQSVEANKTMQPTADASAD